MTETPEARGNLVRAIAAAMIARISHMEEVYVSTPDEWGYTRIDGRVSFEAVAHAALDEVADAIHEYMTWDEEDLKSTIDSQLADDHSAPGPTSPYGGPRPFLCPLMRLTDSARSPNQCGG